MFAIIQNNLVALMVQAGTAFEWDNISYPQNWCNLSTPEEKAAIGMVDVVYAPRPDDKYYWVSQDAPVIGNGVVNVNYTATPKDLDATKANLVSAVQNAAYSILLPTDWMVVKAMETGTVVSSDWATWRQTIRNQAAQAVADIGFCQDIDSLAALAPVQWAHDPNFIESSN